MKIRQMQTYPQAIIFSMANHIQNESSKEILHETYLGIDTKKSENIL